MADLVPLHLLLCLLNCIPLTGFAYLHEGCYIIRKAFLFSTPIFTAYTPISGQPRIFHINLSSEPKRAIRHGQGQGRQGRLPAQGA